MPLILLTSTRHIQSRHECGYWPTRTSPCQQWRNCSDRHDVLWVRTGAPGSKDSVLLDLVSAGVILFRVNPAVPGVLTPVVRRALGTDREWAGLVSIVTIDEIRMVRTCTRT